MALAAHSRASAHCSSIPSRAERQSRPKAQIRRHDSHMDKYLSLTLMGSVPTAQSCNTGRATCTCCGAALREDSCSTSYQGVSEGRRYRRRLRGCSNSRSQIACRVAETESPTPIKVALENSLPLQLHSPSSVQLPISNGICAQLHSAGPVLVPLDSPVAAQLHVDVPPAPLTVPAVTSPVRPAGSLSDQEEWEQPSEAGILPDQALQTIAATAAVAEADSKGLTNHVRDSWHALMRWSKVFRSKKDTATTVLQEAQKIVVFGGGSFGTAMGVALARQQPDLDVVLLLRDPLLCRDINNSHCNTKYLKDFVLPPNVRATTLAAEAITGAKYAVHAVPVQASRKFLVGIKDLLPASVPIICVSKGLEVPHGHLMSEVIPSALDRRQPAVFLSGPSFAKEVMENRPTGVVAACRDPKLARLVQSLFASPVMRVNGSSDVVGVEICGALKNVLAIAAGIVEGMDLGHNAMAALISQGCSEIRWLAEKMGAKPATISGLSGLGDIMLTCYGSLSRNRSVGVRLGRGEKLEDIVSSTSQVAEGVATAGVVVLLAKRHRVSLPVLTAVAQVVEGNITPHQAVWDIMSLPQVEEV